MVSEHPLSVINVQWCNQILLTRPKLPKILATNLNFHFQEHKILWWKQKSSFVALRQLQLWSGVTVRRVIVNWIAAHSHQPHWPFWVHHSVVITSDSIHNLAYVFILFWPHQLTMSTYDYSTPWCEVSKHSSNRSICQYHWFHKVAVSHKNQP